MIAPKVNGQQLRATIPDITSRKVLQCEPVDERVLQKSQIMPWIGGIFKTRHLDCWHCQDSAPHKLNGQVERNNRLVRKQPRVLSTSLDVIVALTPEGRELFGWGM